MNRFFTLLLAASCLTAVGQVPDYVPTDGLISWYNLNGDAIDEMGIHDGTLLGAYPVANRQGEQGAALGFEDGDYADLGTYTEIQGLCEFSTSIWFYGLEEQGSGCCNMLWCSGHNEYLLNLSNWTPKLSFDPGLSCGGAATTNYVGQLYGQWHHAVAQLVSGNEELWLDGSLVSSSPLSSCVCSHNDKMTLATMDGFPHDLNGYLDEFGVWNRALSEFEIQALYTQTPPVYGCLDSLACNYDPLANVDDDSCIPAGCMDETACNFNDEAGCDDGTCIVLDPVLCGADTIIQVDLCGQDSIQLGFGSSEQQPLVPITQLNWKSSCEFQEGWNLMGFDDSLWSAPIQTICGGFSSGDQLAAQYVDCGGDDHMIWAGDCSSSYFRFPFLWDGASSLYLELGADDSFEAFLNGELIFEGAGWETCYQVDQFENALIGENLLAIQASDIGSCKGLFGKAHGSSFQQNHLWSTGESSSQIWVDGPGIYTVTLWEENFTAAFIVTNENLQGCTVANACNYNELAVCDDSSCIYPLVGNDCFQGQISCGPGTLWDSTNQVCIPSPDVCHEGTVWDSELQQCIVANPSDSNFDGCVQLGDLLDLLSAYGDCAAEELAWQCGDPLEYQGYDYATVQIGEQCWFAEDLRASSFNDGTEIVNGQGNGWESTTDLSQTYPRFLESCNYSFVASSNFIYNWDAVRDDRGLCPIGWSVGGQGDFEQLFDVDPYQLLSSSIPSNWYQGYSSEIGLSGFEVLPNGLYWADSFGDTNPNVDCQASAHWWTSTPNGISVDGCCVNNANYVWMNIGTFVNYETPTMISGYMPVHRGLSVRCIKDAQ